MSAAALHCDPAASAFWAWIKSPWRIALASSPEYAPLYLARRGDRIAWVQDRDEAEPFASRGQAQLFAAEEVHSDVAVRISK